jgi:hypothetical protein
MGGFELGSKFVIEKETDAYMYIIDTGVNEKSVTNDVVNVLAYLTENYNLENRRLIYRDSMGQIDEIKHYYGKFLSFFPGHSDIKDL